MVLVSATEGMLSFDLMMEKTISEFYTNSVHFFLIHSLAHLFNFVLSSFVSLTALISSPVSHSAPTDVLDGVECHLGDDAIDGERGEDEEEWRAENEQLPVACGDDDTDETTDAASSSAPLLVTNPLSLEASLPATSSTQGTSGLTNTGFELASLGKVTSHLCGAACLSSFSLTHVPVTHVPCVICTLTVMNTPLI